MQGDMLDEKHSTVTVHTMKITSQPKLGKWEYNILTSSISFKKSSSIEFYTQKKYPSKMKAK